MHKRHNVITDEDDEYGINNNHHISNNNSNNNGWITKKRSNAFNGMLEVIDTTEGDLPTPKFEELKPGIRALQWRLKEEKQVHRKYNQMCRAAQEWKNQQLEEIHQFYLRTRMHSVCPNQFHIENGNRACSCIIWTVAEQYVNSDTQQPLHFPWDDIMTRAVDLWISRPPDPKDGTPGHINMMQVETLEGNKSSTMKKLGEVMGELDGEESHESEGRYCLKDGLEAMRSIYGIHYNRFAISLTARKYTVCILSDHYTWWIFDSHGLLNDQKSTLIELMSMQDVYTFLRKLPYTRESTPEDFEVEDADDISILFYSMCIYSNDVAQSCNRTNST